MPKEINVRINSKSVVDEFDKHIKNPINSRIIFSSPFGTGKSTFLSDFFSARKNGYININLYPVNYSVISSQDIFEQIKFDLLFQLLDRYPIEINLEEDAFSNSLLAQMFILHQLKIDKPLLAALKTASIIKGEAAEIISSLQDVYSKYEKYKNDIKIDDLKSINAYFKSFETKKGSLYEFDEITNLIIDLLGRIKKAKEQSYDEEINENISIESVLIIDDLDRLDPEHIFRLFNIFSAHYNAVTQDNKFGFDKIIFVCDIKNIRLMYEHKYGKHVDFNGYIDKFYSTREFSFDNRKHLKEKIHEIIRVKEQNITREYQNVYGLSLEGPFYSSFLYIIYYLVDRHIITIRNIEQFDSYTLRNERLIGHSTKAKVHFDSMEFRFLTLIQLLNKLFTLSQIKVYFELLKNEFNDKKTQESHYYDIEAIEGYLINDCLPFIINENLIFNIENTNDAVFQLNGINYTASMKKYSNHQICYPEIVRASKRINIFEFLEMALNNAVKRGFLNSIKT